MQESMDHFEGPEKKLEIILASPQPGLRDNRDGRWNRVVACCGATIVNKISTAHLDAYLLSESSLFVWEDCILMITCGKTTLINAMSEILRIIDRDNVAFVFYERKNFMFPDEQPSDFEQEFTDLQRYFPGKSYRLGPANHDHLHMYYFHANIPPAPDATLQILMTDLGPSARFFSTDTAGTPERVAELSGLSRLFPGAVTDSFLFFPQGYSMNGIVGGKYFTVHITPQLTGSYTSFETNIPQEDYSELIRNVVSLFEPGAFSLALTTSMDAHYHSLHGSLATSMPGFRVTEKSLYEFDCGYAVTFSNHVNTLRENR